MNWGKKESRRKKERPAGPANPFEAFMLSLCLLQGLLVLTGAARPTSMMEALPHPVRLTWAALLFCGGTLAVSGLYWPLDPFTGVEVKRVGMIAAGFGTLAYGVALLLSYGPPGLLAATSNFAFTAACLTRVVQVTRGLRVARIRMSRARDERSP